MQKSHLGMLFGTETAYRHLSFSPSFNLSVDTGSELFVESCQVISLMLFQTFAVHGVELVEARVEQYLIGVAYKGAHV